MPSKIITRKPGLAMMGQMNRFKTNCDVMPPGPQISPEIQGPRAFSLLTAEQKGQLKYALKDAGKVHKCDAKSLEWRFDKFGCVHIRKRVRIEIPVVKV